MLTQNSCVTTKNVKLTCEQITIKCKREKEREEST